jgi:methylase of polypeptide subunit release factors
VRTFTLRSLLTTDDTQTIDALRARLREVHYNAERVRDAIGGEEFLHVDADRELHRRRLKPADPLTPLIRLFLLHDALPEAEAARALRPARVAALETMGLVRVDGGVVSARTRILPMIDFLIASDPLDELALADADYDFVGNVNPTSRTLAGMTVRRPVDSALDVGTGGGVQALFLARHAKRVVATDVNPRALAYTRLNARLNGISNIETREGSFFEPVEGERFGVVVSNPPFVISPETRFSFRDSELGAPEVCRLVAEGIADHLEPGGFGHMLASWFHREGETWDVVPTAWVEGHGCDAWILHQGQEDPLEYASTWNLVLRLSDPGAYGETIDRWTDHYRELGAVAMHYGAIVLRRRDGRNWTKLDDMPAKPMGEAGEQVQRVFRAQDQLEEGGLESLLDRRFRVIPEHRVEQVGQLSTGTVAGETLTLSLTSGVAFDGAMDVWGLEVLLRLDGKTTVREAFAAVAERAGIALPSFTKGALPVFARLYGLGFLVTA